MFGHTRTWAVVTFRRREDAEKLLASDLKQDVSQQRNPHVAMPASYIYVGIALDCAVVFMLSRVGTALLQYINAGA